MSTKYYQWGKLAGGTDASGGSSVPADASYGPAQDFSNTLAAGVTVTLNFTSLTKAVRVQNTHDTASFTYSIDGGVTFRTIGPYGYLDEAVSVSSVILVGGTDASSYYVRGTLTE